MTPTNKLRFVERDEIVVQHPAPIFTRTVRILQQWYANPVSSPTRGEWRDVPVEKEHG
jgi:hypothetical protein